MRRPTSSPWIGALTRALALCVASSFALVACAPHSVVPSPAQPAVPMARVLVVDAGTGRDTHPGTEAAPLATLKAAHDITLPGDTVLVRNGRYEQTGIEGVVHITRSGMPGAFITYKP